MKDRGVNVVAINNSWGGGDYGQALYDAIRATTDRGILCINAAGNDGWDNDIYPSYPASYYLPNVISVGATTSTDSSPWFTDYGLRTVHVSALQVGRTSWTEFSYYKPSLKDQMSIRWSLGNTLTIDETRLPDATAGVPYNATLGASGGTPPFNWSVVDGTPAHLVTSSSRTS